MDFDEQKEQELMELIQTAMKDKGSKSVAEEVGKAYSTLRSELNAQNKDHKLGISTFLKLIDLIDNKDILQWFGKQYGYLLIPMPTTKPSPSESIERLMIQAGKDFGEISKTFLEVTDINSEEGQSISANEWKLLDRALLQAIQSYYRIRQVSETLTQHPPS
ncbi:MAG: hypothetical protein HQM13_16985 [SAR324 cluster bacterium]|nr:hypothetical protein [SAR324 cluster bacterium]